MGIIMDDAFTGYPPVLIYNINTIVLKHSAQVGLRYHLAPLTTGSSLG